MFTPEHGLYLALAALGPVTANVVAAGVTRVAFNAPPQLFRWVRAAPLALAPLAAFAWTQPVLERQRTLADEESAYRATLAHSPSPRACFNLGVLLLGERRDAEAARTYEDCVELSPSDAGMYVQLGVAYQRIGERNKAEIAFAKAVDLAPGDALAWSNYANLEAASGFYPEARAKWQKALAIDAGVRAGAGRTEEARRGHRARAPPRLRLRRRLELAHRVGDRGSFESPSQRPRNPEADVDGLAAGGLGETGLELDELVAALDRAHVAVDESPGEPRPVACRGRTSV